jgi:hypothetical protein
MVVRTSIFHLTEWWWWSINPHFLVPPSGSRVILYYKEHRIDNELRRITFFAKENSTTLRQNIHLSNHMSIYKTT